MDAETSRLVMVAIISATAAIIAGIGGATLTAWINRITAKETLDAAKAARDEDWERKQQEAHEAWLREKKFDAYSDLITRMNPLSPTMMQAELHEKMSTIFGNLALVGDRDVVPLAQQLQQSVDELYKLGKRDGSAMTADEEEVFRAVALKIGEQSYNLTSAMRSGLGVAQ